MKANRPSLLHRGSSIKSCRPAASRLEYSLTRRISQLASIWPPNHAHHSSSLMTSAGQHAGSVRPDTAGAPWWRHASPWMGDKQRPTCREGKTWLTKTSWPSTTARAESASRCCSGAG